MYSPRHRRNSPASKSLGPRIWAMPQRPRVVRLSLPSHQSPPLPENRQRHSCRTALVEFLRGASAIRPVTLRCHGNLVDSSPAVANEVVYVGSEGGKVYALSAGTGDLLWSSTIGGPCFPRPQWRMRWHMSARETPQIATTHFFSHDECTTCWKRDDRVARASRTGERVFLSCDAARLDSEPS
jgi:hypothetical protein